MKLTGRDAAAYLAKPSSSHAGLLVFGADPTQVADKRRQAVTSCVGPGAEEEMRLTRIAAADLRKDPAQLHDAIKAQGFFPGPRVALVTDATDGLAKGIAAALDDWQDGDAKVIVTAGALPARSALRKAFETNGNAVAIGIYDDPPSRSDIDDQLVKAGFRDVSRDVSDSAFALSLGLTPSDFRQTLEKLALYKQGDPTPLTPQDLTACAPQSADVDVDDVIGVVASGQVDKVGAALMALYAQGVTPVSLCIGTMRHFRRLHQVASDPDGAGAGAGRLRPPVFGPRRDQLLRQVSQWGRDRLERAIQTLTETDLTLRSSSNAPDAAVMERALIRLAMMVRAGGARP